MTTIKLEEDCLVPDTQIVLRYKGPNPYSVYPQIKRLMRNIWEIEAIGFWEREFRWDNSGDPRGFLVKCYVERGIDRFSRVLIEVFIQGNQPSDPTQPGNMEIRIGGVLRSNFGGTSVLDDARNPIFKIFFWFYHKYFYQHQRRYYIREWCYNRINKLKTEIQHILNIIPPQQKL